MTPFLAEIIGTALLILFGGGTVANVLLAKTKGNGSGWIVITTGWAMGVFFGAFTVASISGAHLNPAISVGMAVAGKFPWANVPGYVIAQMIGAIFGAVLVWLAYLPHWRETDDPALKRDVFCTSPAIGRPLANLLCEFIGTFALVFGLFAIKGAVLQQDTDSAVPINMGALGLLPVAFLVWGIGIALGGPTGYAINPARDLGPRIAHAILPIAGKGSSRWGYAWVPVVGPVLGAWAAAALYQLLGSF
jgi:glycerol uptake facilitator protein